MSHYPTLEELLKGENREELLVVKRALRSILSSFALLLLLLGNAAVTIRWNAGGPLSTTLPVLRSISSYWSLVLPALMLLEIIRKYHNDLYIFGLSNLVQKGGRLSLNYTIPVVKYIDIREMVVRQDIIGRIFNFGSIDLATAGTGGIDLTIRGVIAPTELSVLIEDLRSYNLENPLAEGESASEALPATESQTDIAAGV